jgi:hypothetical protein
MKPKQLLNDYLCGYISAEELRTLLAKDKSRGARQALEILNMDDSGRKGLREFSPSPGAAERLAEKVAAVETWTQAEAQAQEGAPSRNWFLRLVPAMDVVGHGHSERAEKRPKKSKAIKKTRSRKRLPPLAKNKK